MHPFPALQTVFPLIPFPTEEITGCTNEVANGTNKARNNPPSYFLM